MFIEVLKSKLAHATITEAELFYEGSITVDENLMKAANLLPHEKVDVLNLNNGSRIQTYVIKGKAGSGQVCLNGPAARCGLVGDRIIILSYAMVDQSEAESFVPTIVLLDHDNKIKS